MRSARRSRQKLVLNVGFFAPRHRHSRRKWRKSLGFPRARARGSKTPLRAPAVQLIRASPLQMASTRPKARKSGSQRTRQWRETDFEVSVPRISDNAFKSAPFDHSGHSPSTASTPPPERGKVLPMCPVRSVTYVSGRSWSARTAPTNAGRGPLTTFSICCTGPARTGTARRQSRLAGSLRFFAAEPGGIQPYRRAV
jgi:hypothetical protein